MSLLITLLLFATHLSSPVEWYPSGPVPIPVSHNAVGVINDDTIYLLGGPDLITYTGANKGSWIMKYNATESVNWEILTITTPTGFVATQSTVTINEYVFVFGPRTSPNPGDAVYIFNTISEQFETNYIKPIPKSVEFPCVTKSDTKIYVHGGRINGIFYDYLQIYLIAENKWIPPNITSPMPAAIDYCSCLYYQHHNYLFGGEIRELQEALDDIYSYDTISDIWSSSPIAKMTKPRTGSQAALFGVLILIIGGRGADVNSSDYFFDIFDPKTNTVSNQYIPVAVTVPCVARVKDRIFVIGGYNYTESAPGNWLAHNEVFVSSPTTIAPTTVSPTTILPTTVSPTTISPTSIPTTTISPPTISPPTILPTTISSSALPPMVIMKNGACKDGYKVYHDNNGFCEPCYLNEAGIGGICQICHDGTKSNKNRTKCILCTETAIGLNGYCHINCSDTNQLSNELHTSCIENESVKEMKLTINSNIFKVIISFLTICTFGIVVAMLLILYHIKPDKFMHWLTLCTIFIAFCSSFGSFALSRGLQIEDKGSGIIAIFMAMWCFVVCIIRILIGHKMQNIDVWQKHLFHVKSIAVFDFFQGVAAIYNEQYTSNSFTILLISTWIGVGDEFLECIVELFFMTLENRCQMMFVFTFFIWSIIEASMGIYLLTTFSTVGLKASGIIFELSIVVTAFYYICKFFGLRFKPYGVVDAINDEPQGRVNYQVVISNLRLKVK